MTMSPASRPGAPAPGLRLRLVLAFYLLAAALMPLAHHDIVCHLKSSTHCITCVVGASAESAAEPAVFAPFALNDAGVAACAVVDGVVSVPHCTIPGRAPPASA